MSRELFSPSVVGVSTAARRGRLLPLSILFHAVLIGGVLALQLFADTAAPDPQRPLNYRITPIAQTPPPPAAPVRRAVPSQGTRRSDLAPLVTPDKMPSIDSPGQDTIIMEGPVELEGGDGVPGGLVEGGTPVTSPPPAAPEPLRHVGGVIKAPVKIRDVNPVYPAIAQSAHVEGLVILEAVIDEQGRVSATRVLKHVPLLDDAAETAVRQWVYSPTLLNGQPIPVVMTVTVHFRLER